LNEVIIWGSPQKRKKINNFFHLNIVPTKGHIYYSKSIDKHKKQGDAISFWLHKEKKTKNRVMPN